MHYTSALLSLPSSHSTAEILWVYHTAPTGLKMTNNHRHHRRQQRAPVDRAQHQKVTGGQPRSVCPTDLCLPSSAPSTHMPASQPHRDLSQCRAGAPRLLLAPSPSHTERSLSFIQNFNSLALCGQINSNEIRQKASMEAQAFNYIWISSWTSIFQHTIIL